MAESPAKIIDIQFDKSRLLCILAYFEFFFNIFLKIFLYKLLKFFYKKKTKNFVGFLCLIA